MRAGARASDAKMHSDISGKAEGDRWARLWARGQRPEQSNQLAL